MDWSGFRFVRQAAPKSRAPRAFDEGGGLPIAIVNRGRTRGDEFAELKIEGDVGAVLTEVIGDGR